MMINSSFVPLGHEMEGINTPAAQTTFTLRFSPESYECRAMAGLLACPTFDNLPARRPADSGFRKIKSLWNSQHRGMLRIFTGFPF